jgi:hypothetical protein
MAAKKDKTGTIFMFRWISPDGPCSVVRVLIDEQLSETAVAMQTIKRLFRRPVITDHIMKISLMVSQLVTFVLAGKTISTHHTRRNIGKAVHHGQLISAI